MVVTLDWLGVATFRLTIDDLVLFLDAYMDRVPAAPPVGLTTDEVQRADFILVGHSHFDHLWGAERIARNTGATIIGSHESVRLMVDEEVPERQLIAVAGGERVQLSDTVSVRVFPSQHSCIWTNAGRTADEVCLGDWMPPTTRPTDVTPIREELARQSPGVELVEMGYLEAYPILAGIR